LKPSESIRVVYVGRVSEMKGIRVLLDAWDLAQPRGLELVIAGDGPMRANLMAIPPSSSIRYLGALPHIEAKRLISSARALVFPSLRAEGQPMVLLEAMAAGTPIIASEGWGIPETMASGRAGWLTPAGDVCALAGRLADLNNDGVADKMAESARKIYEERYSPAVGLQNLLAVYNTFKNK